jgi:hypothetical protein
MDVLILPFGLNDFNGDVKVASHKDIGNKLPRPAEGIADDNAMAFRQSGPAGVLAPLVSFGDFGLIEDVFALVVDEVHIGLEMLEALVGVALGDGRLSTSWKAPDDDELLGHEGFW